MKRTDLLRSLTARGCLLKREGAAHSMWKNAAGFTQAIPRHNEIDEDLARSICRKLGLSDPMRREK